MLTLVRFSIAHSDGLLLQGALPRPPTRSLCGKREVGKALTDDAMRLSAGWEWLVIVVIIGTLILKNECETPKKEFGMKIHMVSGL